MNVQVTVITINVEAVATGKHVVLSRSKYTEQMALGLLESK